MAARDLALNRTGQPQAEAGRVAAAQPAGLRISRIAQDWLLPWLFPLALLLLWQLSALQGWAPEQVLPPPGAVYDSFAALLASGELWDHLQVSLVRVFSGFGIGLSAGLLLGGAMGLSPTLRDYLFPLFKAFSQVPTLG